MDRASIIEDLKEYLKQVAFTYDEKTIMITYKWSDGTSFSGTLDALKTVAKVLSKQIDYENLIVPQGYYFSLTKGLIPIKEMNTLHIKNTIKKKITNYNKTINHLSDLNLETLYLNWIQNNQIIQDLFNELKNRGEKL